MPRSIRFYCYPIFLDDLNSGERGRVKNILLIESLKGKIRLTHLTLFFYGLFHQIFHSEKFQLTPYFFRLGSEFNMKILKAAIRVLSS